jgi:hypothetical protein
LFVSTQRTAEIRKLDEKSKKEQALIPAEDALPLVRNLALTKSIFDNDLDQMLRIDWFGVHRTCVEIFRRLWSVLKRSICMVLQSPEDAAMEDESQLGYLAGWLMRTLEERRHLAADRLLKAAAKEIEGFKKKLEIRKYSIDM